MLKRISYFCILLSVLSLVGGFILMANSLTPLFYFISGVFIALLWIAIAIVLQEFAKMQAEIASFSEMKTNIELQTKFMKRLTKRNS